MTEPKHIHKYKRKTLGDPRKNYIVYACTLNCTHYLVPELIEGKECICWDCREPFIMSKRSAKRTKPKCPACVGRNSMRIAA